MKLEVPQLRDAYLRVAAMVRSFGGFVADSSIEADGSDSDKATMRLRVPASRHDELLSALRGMSSGHVIKESSTAQEVTAEYTDTQSRLSNFQAAEAQYRELLKQAKSIDEILNVQSKLDNIRGQIEQARGQLNLLDNEVDYATVNLTLTVPGASASEGIATPKEAFDDSWNAATVIARVALNLGIMVLVAAIWLAVPAAIVLAAVWLTSRRQSAPPRPPRGGGKIAAASGSSESPGAPASQ
jgi:hypothetical protein